MFLSSFGVMEEPLETLSKQELIALLKQQKQAQIQAAASIQKTHQQALEKEQNRTQQEQQKVAHLQLQVDHLKRLLYGQKRERFEGNPDQLALPFQADEQRVAQQDEALEENREKVKKQEKIQRSAHRGRQPLPAHLEVEEIKIYPEADLSDQVCIGKEITEELECVPARFFIKRYIRYKYAPKKQVLADIKTKILIGELPERVIDKGIPGASLLALILIDKYQDHLPLYRQRQRFLRENIPIASSTLEGWVRQALQKLQILYEHLLADTLSKGYLQVDESPIPVLDKNKKGRTHQGYYWVYHNPLDEILFFDYQPGRGNKAAHLLNDFKGYLQTDGYSVYEKLVKARKGELVHLACWAHARREFEKALSEDKASAEIALGYIQQLYAVEREAKAQSAGERKNLRLEKSLPLINAMGKWMLAKAKSTLPKSQLGKALQYSIKRWPELSNYLLDGHLQIDNNLVENAIRPVALGRKNYLFAGSHDAAKRAAVIYSLLAICKKHHINPYDWLKHTLENIMTTNIQNIKSLYPQNWNSQ